MTQYGAPTSEYAFYLGIDPGIHGALALMNAAGTTAKVWPMPIRDDGHGNEIDLVQLRGILGLLVSPGQRLFTFAGLEWPMPWPGSFENNPADADNLGRQKGIIETMLFFHGYAYSRIVPTLWKGRLGLKGKTQDKGSSEAVKLWDALYPQFTHLIRGPRGGIQSGPLDALLIAHFCRQRSSANMAVLREKFKGDPIAGFLSFGSKRLARKRPRRI